MKPHHFWPALEKCFLLPMDKFIIAHFGNIPSDTDGSNAVLLHPADK